MSSSERNSVDASNVTDRLSQGDYSGHLQLQRQKSATAPKPKPKPKPKVVKTLSDPESVLKSLDDVLDRHEGNTVDSQVEDHADVPASVANVTGYLSAARVSEGEYMASPPTDYDNAIDGEQQGVRSPTRMMDSETTSDYQSDSRGSIDINEMVMACHSGDLPFQRAVVLGFSLGSPLGLLSGFLNLGLKLVLVLGLGLESVG